MNAGGWINKPLTHSPNKVTGRAEGRGDRCRANIETRLFNLESDMKNRTRDCLGHWGKKDQES